jgi:aromatic ring-opening dioxygenase catalytic subunit (LigB family)
MPLESAMSETRFPALYISHGGGPCFFMDWPGAPPNPWDPLADYLRGIMASLGRVPKAIVAVSAHWEERVATVNVNPAPPLLFDYYNFPPHTYELKYPAPGAPALARRVRNLLAAAGIDSGEESARGLDHGVFVPFLLIDPAAEIPVLQLSLRHDLDARFHIDLGRALAPLRDEDVLIVGSGFSFHNLSAFFGPNRPALIPESRRFDDWLTATVETADADARDAALADWATAPGGRACHPREEHLLPLMVAAGAGAGDRGRRVFSGDFLGLAYSCYQWGG